MFLSQSGNVIPGVWGITLPAAILLSLSHPAVPPQATIASVHIGWASLEIGTTDYAPTCGNRRRQGSCGIRNSAIDLASPRLSLEQRREIQSVICSAWSIS